MRKDFLPEAQSCKTPHFFYKPKDQPTNRAAGMVLFAQGLLLIASWMSDRVSLRADLGRADINILYRKIRTSGNFGAASLLPGSFTNITCCQSWHWYNRWPDGYPQCHLTEKATETQSPAQHQTSRKWRVLESSWDSLPALQSGFMKWGQQHLDSEIPTQRRQSYRALGGFPYEVGSGQPKSSLLFRSLWLLSLHTQSRSFSASPEPRCHLGKSGQGLSGPELLTLASSHLAVGKALTLVAPSWGHVSVLGNPVWEPWFWGVEFFSC